MVAVNTIDGIKYGFRLMGYLLAVFLIGAIVAAVGVVIGENSPVLGGIITLIGLAVFYAGGLGMLFKVIADGVEVGNRAAKGDTTARGGSGFFDSFGGGSAAGQTGQGQPPAAGQRGGGQQAASGGQGQQPGQTGQRGGQTSQRQQTGQAQRGGQQGYDNK